jgi:phosphatidylethanolamine/phosphatidyl-N-methylethanolamine N-methyltransferase
MAKRTEKRVRFNAAEHLAFLRGFLKHPNQVGSIIPSSQFLERRIARLADLGRARVVVELGPGTGGTTRAILGAMKDNAKLLCIELNAQFHAMLRRIEDPRLIVYLGSAGELREAMTRYGIDGADAVISGIPFSTMSRATASRILDAISSALLPGGRFIAYQVRGHVETLSRPYFGPAQMDVELLNIPPVRIYRWEKHAASSASLQRSAAAGR